MRVAIHQPHCYPWAGFFHKMDSCDLFVLMDDVQYVRKEWQNRNYFKTLNGKSLLTIPIERCTPEIPIKDKQIDNSIKWQRQHWGTVVSAYGLAPHWPPHREWFLALMTKRWDKLIDFSVEVISYCRTQLRISVPIVRCSELNGVFGKKSERVLSICQAVGAKSLICGVGAQTYLDVARLSANNIDVLWQQFSHPLYRQQFMHHGFLPRLTVLDLIFNHGPMSGDIMRMANYTSSLKASGAIIG